MLRSYAVERNFRFLNGQTVIFIVLALHSKPRGALCCLRPCANAISVAAAGEPHAKDGHKPSLRADAHPSPHAAFPKLHQETSPANAPPWGRETPSFQLPGRKGVLHLCGMGGSAEMPQTQFQIRWSLENCCKEVVSAFSSLTVQVVGY